MLTNSNIGIYKVTSPTGKVYIGQSLNISNRKSHYRYLDKAVQKQRKFYASLLKYGFSNHKFEVVHELPKDIDRETLNKYEILYMEAYIGCGVELLNIKEGGLNGRHSEETKQKQRMNGRLGVIVSEETREKMKIAASRPRPYRKGMKWSAEAKLKVRKPYKVNPNRIYHTISEENKIKMQEARKKVPHPFLGKHHSDETKAKISKKKMGCNVVTCNKQIVCSNTGIIFNSIKQAAISIGMEPNTLRMKLRGKSKNETSMNYLTI